MTTLVLVGRNDALEFAEEATWFPTAVRHRDRTGTWRRVVPPRVSDLVPWFEAMTAWLEPSNATVRRSQLVADRERELARQTGGTVTPARTAAEVVAVVRPVLEAWLREQSVASESAGEG